MGILSFTDFILDKWTVCLDKRQDSIDESVCCA